MRDNVYLIGECCSSIKNVDLFVIGISSLSSTHHPCPSDVKFLSLDIIIDELQALQHNIGRSKTDAIPLAQKLCRAILRSIAISMKHTILRIKIASFLAKTLSISWLIKSKNYCKNRNRKKTDKCKK